MKATSSTAKMPIDILLVEPNKLLREQLHIVLTTTGGYLVEATCSLPKHYPDKPRLLMLPLHWAAQFSATSFISWTYLFTSNSLTVPASYLKNMGEKPAEIIHTRQCLGVVALKPYTAIAEQVRQKLMTVL